MHKHFKRVIYSSDLFTYNAKYFQTLSGDKWRSFASSLRGMLILRSTVHGVALQFNNFAYSFGLMFVWPKLSTDLIFRSQQI